MPKIIDWVVFCVFLCLVIVIAVISKSLEFFIGGVGILIGMVLKFKKYDIK